MMKSIISIIIILFIFNVNKPIFKNDAIYIITRSTEFKEDFIAKDFNIIDTLSTHVGIGFAEEGKLKIYNVSNDQMLNNSALICDDYKSFTSLKSIKYISIWEKKVTTERMSYFKSILLEYKKEKIYFDYDFLLNNDNYLYCSEFVANVLTKFDTNYKIKPIKKELNTFYSKALNRKFITYIPVDFFRKDSAFKLIYQKKY